MALSTAQGFIGAGDVYIAPIGVGDVLGKLIDIGNTTQLGIKPNSNILEQISKKRDSYGDPLETVALKQPADLTMTLETVNIANLRYAFMGEDAAYTQASGTVTDEATTAKLDGWVQLGAEEISSLVLTNTGATVTYVEGTDYVVNTRLGMYKALSGGAITEDQALLADYSRAAFTGAAIRGSTQAQIRAFLLLDGINKVDDSIGILKVWEVVLSPSGEFDWFRSEFNTIPMTGRIKKPVSRTEPFKFFAR